MGMAASQWNFGILTDRKLAIGLELEQLSMTKESLTRNMQRVSREYRDALSTKTLKWSGNSGVTYTDLSYSTLMKPGGTPNNTPMLITNSNGNVVLDEQYAEYAALLASKGGKYEGDVRYEILTGLIPSLTVETLQKYDETAKDVEDKYAASIEARDARDAVANKKYSPENFITDFLSPAKLSYNKADTLNKGNVDAFATSVYNAICGKDYFPAEIEKNIKTACDASASDIKNNDGKEGYTNPTKEAFVSAIVSTLKRELGGSDTIKVMIDKRNNNAGTQSEYDAADAAFKAAQEAYQTAVGENAQVIDAPTKKKIEYYDQLFQAIVDMGWEEDKGLSDTDYLNQMLQNNSYYITTMTKNTGYDDSLDISDRNFMYYYDTELAENDPNIFKVNDSDVHQEALVKYEYEKSLINAKEKRIDTRMKNLETEQSAIQKMLDSIDKVKNDNIDRTYSLWA